MDECILVSMQSTSRMEEELKCPVCRRLYTNPVLLPCSHSLCLACGVNIQVPAQSLQAPTEETSTTAVSEFGDSNPDIDKLSLLSETDSGVVVNSRPNSYVGTPSIGSFYFTQTTPNSQAVNCPVCKRNIFLDETGVNCLPKNRVLETIVDKYGENKNIELHCQLCEGKNTPANIMCEQCEVFYCDDCKDSCHPMRGPLAQHNLVSPTDGKVLLRQKHRTKELKCREHVDENLSLYCVLCKTSVCCVCVQDGQHINHDAQPLGAMCKAQKVSSSNTYKKVFRKTM